MIVYEVATEQLDAKHTIADLNSGITFIVLFQSGEAFTVEGNKHTQTHTHTHTHTRKHANEKPRPALIKYGIWDQMRM